ncbi:hypothetical protein DFH09DRAFT_167457 [Mycena vulgaris]|nr:hypothetical protein DFH09DRAFT_167457 [Mycena vulgaris]
MLLLSSVVPLLLALLTQVTLSEAVPRHGHGDFHPSFSFGFPIGSPSSSTSVSTTSIVSTSTIQPVTTLEPTPAQSFQNAVQLSTDAVSSPIHSSPSPSKSSSRTVLIRSSQSFTLAGLLSTGTASLLSHSTPSDGASTSPETSESPIPFSSTKSNKSRKLIEILVPVLLAALIAGAFIFVLYRRRRVQEKKGWEGSRLPELDTPSQWSFGRPRDTATHSRLRDGRNTYTGAGDWNRSDAHLRVANYEKDLPSIHESEAVTENGSEDHAWEPPHSDPGHDFTRAFHSESPLHEQDEPALAESRPATLLVPVNVPVSREVPAGPVTY